MAAKVKVGVLVVLIVASSAAFAASANTTATVERDSTINVADDSNGLLALQANTSGQFVSNDGGQLSIDFSSANADGVNRNATYTVGDTNSPNSSHAFNITNQDDDPRDITVNYVLDGDDPNASTDNVQFHVFSETSDSTITNEGSASEGTDSGVTVSSVAPADKIYVVLEVDTSGLTASDSLSGTLEISI